MTFVDNRAPPQAGASVWGDALCLLSAGFYAAYTVAIRRMLPEDESAPMMLFFGYVGLLNLTCLSPVLGLLVLGGAVDLRALTGKLFGATVLKGDAPGPREPRAAESGQGQGGSASQWSWLSRQPERCDQVLCCGCQPARFWSVGSLLVHQKRHYCLAPPTLSAPGWL